MKMNKNKEKILRELAVKNVLGQPKTASEMVNKYGTYEIQPTADSDNDFPKIAQGLPKKKNRKVLDED